MKDFQVWLDIDAFYADWGSANSLQIESNVNPLRLQWLRCLE